MKVLMLSIDKTLLGSQIEGSFGVQGDTIARHVKYGELVEKLDIIVTSPAGFKENKLSDKVTVYPTNAANSLEHMKAVLNIAERIQTEQGIDLIVAQDLTAPAALKLKKKFNIPYIVSTHGADWDSPDNKRGLRRIIELWLIRKAMLQADGLRVVSPAIKDYYAEQGLKCSIEVIPTPSDFSIFAEKDSRVDEIKNKYSEKIILTDGRLVEVKNYPMLLEVVKILINNSHAELGLVSKEIPDRVRDDSKFKLLIIGSGDLENKLKNQVKEFGLEDNIYFLGSMPYEDLVPYYQACDVFVLASNSESLGKVLIQAGAAAKPVVATKTLGAQGIVQDGQTGYLVELNDSKQLAGKISELLSDEDLSLKMGKLAQEQVLGKYNSEKNTQRFVDFWQQVYNKHTK